MRTYDLILVLKPAITDAERKKVLGSVKTWLKDVKVTGENEWGKKALSYPIKHETSGYYVEYNLEGETFPADFEKRLINNENVLRHLLLRK